MTATTERILRLIEKAGPNGISREELHRLHFGPLPADEIDRAVRPLLKTGELQELRRTPRPGVGGRAATLYRYATTDQIGDNKR
ncbi:hypothetical protein ACGFIU_00700 [Rhodococcus oryzae]|uniref:hypothetical protein n=1 Tax=Rhodococcus oryzae TaxID=2571143 RepID=UPI00371B5422